MEQLFTQCEFTERRFNFGRMYFYSYAVYGSREKFERKEYEKGLFDVDGRNKEIDEAISMLKQEE